MIDDKGYRPNVGIIICNASGQVVWARRVGGADAWQFPQGGVHSRENLEQAMYRELNEEVGLQVSDVNVLACTRKWLYYRLPKYLQRRSQSPMCIGQKQRWFLLEMIAEDTLIDLNAHADDPEFDAWKWVSYWYPINQVVDFKRSVYRRALKELSPAYFKYIKSKASITCHKTG